MSGTSNIPKPYSWLHPLKSWLDILFSLIFPYFINLDVITISEPVPESAEKVREFREKLNRHSPQGISRVFKKWSQIMKCPIAEVVLKVPRRPNLLEEWKITEESFENMMPSEEIVVYLYFPVSILNTSVPIPETVNDLGVKQLAAENVHLDELPCDIPLVVHFHGGGMNIGSARDQLGLELIQNVAAAERKPIILASVEYSLSPEQQFPVAPVEGMTVLLHLLSLLPDRKLHVAGCSSGGYMAIVTSMETVRMFPGRIASVLAMNPMLEPKADTESCYMNSKTSYVSKEYGCWSWQAYLGLPRSQDTELSENPTFDDVCKFQSNRTTYNKSRWRGSSVERLVRPIVDVPQTDSLQIIITSNSADPLHTEAVQYAAKLKEVGAKVTHLDHRGSHWLGTYFDSHAYNELAETWRRILFEKA